MKLLKTITAPFAAFFMLFMLSCDNDGSLPHEGLLTVGGAPDFSIDATADGFIDSLDVSSTTLVFNVDIGQGDIQSMDIMVDWTKRYDDTFFNPQAVQANVTSFPSTITVAGDQLLSLFGITANELRVGDQFYFYANLTLNDGTVIQGRDADGALYSPSELSNPLYTVEIVYPVACFVPSDYGIGNYQLQLVNDPGAYYFGATVMTDGEIVTLTQGANPSQRQFDFEWLDEFGITPSTFVFDLICANIIIPLTPGGASCTASIDFGPSATTTTYDPLDDSQFNIFYIHDPSDDCAQGVVEIEFNLIKQ